MPFKLLWKPIDRGTRKLPLPSELAVVEAPGGRGPGLITLTLLLGLSGVALFGVRMVSAIPPPREWNNERERKNKFPRLE